MNRHCNARTRWLPAAGKTLLSAIMILGLLACGEGPGTPGPPQSPPRPVTSEAFLTTAQFDLAARPVVPSPGQM